MTTRLASPRRGKPLLPKRCLLPDGYLEGLATINADRPDACRRIALVAAARLTSFRQREPLFLIVVCLPRGYFKGVSAVDEFPGRLPRGTPRRGNPGIGWAFPGSASAFRRTPPRISRTSASYLRGDRLAPE